MMGPVIDHSATLDFQLSGISVSVSGVSSSLPRVLSKPSFARSFLSIRFVIKRGALNSLLRSFLTPANTRLDEASVSASRRANRQAQP